MALRISDLGTAPTVEETDLVEIAEVDVESPSGYSSYKTTILGIANKVATGTQYTGLNTTAKDLVGAINEAAEGSTVEVTPILTEGTKIATITVDDTPADLYGENTKEEIRKMKTPKTVTGNPVTFETVEETFAKGAELTFGPIQSGTGDPSPTNIRPISGRDSVSLTVGGKNKIPYPYETPSGTVSGGITFTTDNNGRISASGTTGSSVLFTIVSNAVLPAGTYTISVDKDSSPLNVVLRNSTTGTNEWTTRAAGSYTFTANGSDAYEVRMSRSTQGLTVNISDLGIQIEAGSTATAYEPYTAQTHTATFPATVYGGVCKPQ